MGAEEGVEVAMVRGMRNSSALEGSPIGPAPVVCSDPASAAHGWIGGEGSRVILRALPASSASAPTSAGTSGVSMSPLILRVASNAPPSEDFRLIPRPAGSLGSLVPEPVPGAQPGQVSVKVQAVGLNFRDLLVVSKRGRSRRGNAGVSAV